MIAKDNENKITNEIDKAQIELLKINKVNKMNNTEDKLKVILKMTFLNTWNII